jgi:fructokinase
MISIGFDIGGTKMEAALIRWEKSSSLLTSGNAQQFPYQGSDGTFWAGKVLGRERVATERHLGYEQMVSKLHTLIEQTCANAKIAKGDIAGLGFAIPGSVDPVTLRMLNGNTLVLRDKDFAADVAKVFGSQPPKLFSENDANCFALAEAMCGAGVAHSQKSKKSTHGLTSVGIILGTGCGGGVVVNGQTLKGRRGGAGELGHTVLRQGGLRCWCGQQGCAEQYLSGSGLEQQFNGRLYSQVPTFQTAKGIFELYDKQDPVAVGTIKAFRADLGIFLASLTNIFDPDFFVMGGGVSLQKSIYEGVEEDVARQSFLPNTHVPVYQNVLGDSAGVVGAALLVLNSINSQLDLAKAPN